MGNKSSSPIRRPGGHKRKELPPPPARSPPRWQPGREMLPRTARSKAKPAEPGEIFSLHPPCAAQFTSFGQGPRRSPSVSSTSPVGCFSSSGIHSLRTAFPAISCGPERRTGTRIALLCPWRQVLSFLSPSGVHRSTFRVRGKSWLRREFQAPKSDPPGWEGPLFGTLSYVFTCANGHGRGPSRGALRVRDVHVPSGADHDPNPGRGGSSTDNHPGRRSSGRNGRGHPQTPTVPV